MHNLGDKFIYVVDYFLRLIYSCRSCLKRQVDGMDLEIDDLPELSEFNVSMTNTLARASHALTLVEKRVIMGVVAKIDSRKGARAHAHLAEFQKLRISAMDYAETYEVDPKNAYAHLKKAADHLFDRQFSIKTMVGKSERITRFRWVSSATYARDEGFIELSFTPEIYPHLNALKNKYTTYKLRNAASLKSVYSWRLFEFGKSWVEHCRSGKTVRITLENLRHVLEWPESYKWNDAKKRALDPAIGEISKFDHLDIEYEIEKKGRSVHALIFKFIEREQLELKL